MIFSFLALRGDHYTRSDVSWCLWFQIKTSASATKIVEESGIFRRYNEYRNDVRTKDCNTTSHNRIQIIGSEPKLWDKIQHVPGYGPHNCYQDKWRFLTNSRVRPKVLVESADSSNSFFEIIRYGKSDNHGPLTIVSLGRRFGLGRVSVYDKYIVIPWKSNLIWL